MQMTKSKAHRSRDELADAIRGLSDADWNRLRKVAESYARNRPVEPKDLLQESVRRALEGTRICPVHIDVVKFLAESMRSIAHGEKVKGDNQPVLVTIAKHGADEFTVDPPDPRLDPEQLLTSHQETTAFKASLLATFEDDSTAQIIVEGIMEGMEGAELQDLTELDKTAYETKRRLIRRRIDKKFPEGWTS